MEATREARNKSKGKGKRMVEFVLTSISNNALLLILLFHFSCNTKRVDGTTTAAVMQCDMRHKDRGNRKKRGRRREELKHEKPDSLTMNSKRNETKTKDNK